MCPAMKILEHCARCGKCLPFCPSFRATLKETLSPRGRVALIQRGLLEPYPFSTCLLCGACEEVCPNHLPLLEFFIKARAKSSDLLRPIYPLFFKGINWATKEPPRESEILLFLGCGAKFLYSKELSHFLHLFRSFVGELSLLAGVCCGLPYLAAGDLKNFVKEARRVLNFLTEKKTLLTLCSSCLYTFRKFYPAFLNIERPLSEQILSFEDAIAYLLRSGANLSFPQKVFFQVPCHLRHLKEKPWWREKDLAYYEGCCGQAGTFGWRYPKEALSIAKPLQKAIFSSGASILTSNCSSCLLYLKKTFPQLEIRHIASFLRF